MTKYKHEFFVLTNISKYFIKDVDSSLRITLKVITSTFKKVYSLKEDM